MDPEQVTQTADGLRSSVGLAEVERITDEGVLKRYAADWTEEERLAHALTIQSLALADKMQEIEFNDPGHHQPFAVENLESRQQLVENNRRET